MQSHITANSLLPLGKIVSVKLVPPEGGEGRD